MAETLTRRNRFSAGGNKSEQLEEKAMLSGANSVNNLRYQFTNAVNVGVRRAHAFADRVWERFITTRKRRTINVRYANIATADAQLGGTVIRWGPNERNNSTRQRRRVVAIHEVGHILGVPHIAGTIMTGSSSEIGSSGFWKLNRRIFDIMKSAGWRTKGRAPVNLVIPR